MPRSKYARTFAALAWAIQAAALSGCGAAGAARLTIVAAGPRAVVGPAATNGGATAPSAGATATAVGAKVSRAGRPATADRSASAGPKKGAVPPFRVPAIRVPAARSPFQACLVRARTAHAGGMRRYRVQAYLEQATRLGGMLDVTCLPGGLSATVRDTNLRDGDGTRLDWDYGDHVVYRPAAVPLPITLSTADPRLAAYTPLLPYVALPMLLERLAEPPWVEGATLATEVAGEPVLAFALARGAERLEVGFHAVRAEVAFVEVVEPGRRMQLVFQHQE